jgi:glycyl-tRNA synthetase beta subunit
MVMVEDETIRNNSLALLDRIGNVFLRIADFSKLM